jgi:hypothetical protein
MLFSSRIGTALAIAVVGGSLTVSAQNPGRGRDRETMTRIEPGTMISVRTNEMIDAGRTDYRVYSATIDQDVRGNTGGLAIPRGSTVELMVRAAADNDLALDVESVVVNGQRYAVKTDQNRIDSNAPGGLVGSIVGAIRGGDVRGRAVRVPQGTVMSFRLERPLEVGVGDRGIDRDGHHYHDWYGRGRQ